jgi:Flp pilus assembly protein TadG
MFRILVKCSQRPARALARFCFAQKGATAVEFALIAPAFLAVLIALLQTALFLYAQMALQNAAQLAARSFMTGQAQNNNWTQSDIQNTFCPPAMFTCSSIIVIVQNYTSFASANTSAPALYSNGQLITSWTYAPGTPGDVMVVQLVYPWSVVGGPLGFSLSNLPNSAAEIMGVSAFRVEPY